MNHNDPKSQKLSNQVRSQESFYVPPPVYQSSNDIESNSIQSSNNPHAPQVNDALKTQQAQEINRKDQVEMCSPKVPQNKSKQDGQNTESSTDTGPSYQAFDVEQPGLKHCCSDCQECQKREKERQDQNDCQQCIECIQSWNECFS